jgi:hypothetical protein
MWKIRNNKKSAKQERELINERYVKNRNNNKGKCGRKRNVDRDEAVQR